MTARITPKQIKKTNRQLIYDCIYKEKAVTQQDLSYLLHLSRPTIAANLAELEETGLICKIGQQNSDQIGRKAMEYSIVPGYRISIGVEIRRTQVKFIAINLYGEKIGLRYLDLPYKNESAYYEKLCELIREFIDDLALRREQILGIGLSPQGLVSPDGSEVIYGEILGCTGLTTDTFHQYLEYPCRFTHDPAAAAFSELWFSSDLKNAIYLSLSRHLGAATIQRKKIRPGKHGHNSTFEHITVDPNGKRCYCGKRGCLETICSAKALLGDRNPDEFFTAVRNGSTEEADRWQKFLHILAEVIGQLHMVADVDYVLGGHLAPYINESDLDYLYDEIHRQTPFEEADDYIRISKVPSHNIVVGAALPFVQDFLNVMIGQQ